MDFLKADEIYYNNGDFYLILGDCIEIMKNMPDLSVDMIFADPPYFLSNGGITCSGGKMVSVNKGTWDMKESIEDIHNFNYQWIEQCKRVLKENGTLWISGTYHNIYSVGLALQMQNYKILNNITWYKRNAPPNLSCKYFTHSTETILWAKKSEKAKHYFNYSFMKELNGGKQMRDVWEIPVINKKEKKYGNFPAQKPIKLMERIIMSSTKEGDIILDPFNGGGSTGIVASMLNRSYIGIDVEQEHLDLSIRRYTNL